MINSVFFISDTAFQPGDTLPAMDNIFFSTLVDPLEKDALQRTYRVLSDSHASFALTLDISAVPDADSVRFITSFLFLPSYLNINQQPVINLVGTSQEMMDQASEELTRYLLSQQINNVTIHVIKKPGEQVRPGEYDLFTSVERLIEGHEKILTSDDYHSQQLFFYSQTPAAFSSIISTLLKSEGEFKNKNSKLYHIAEKKQALEKEVHELKRKLNSVQAELSHQKQHNDILRLEHSTKKLQDYYNQEYEALPTWYKHLGHIIKAITGKRTFRSLFKDDIKKKRD